MIVRALAALAAEEAEAILARLEDESKRQYMRGEVLARATRRSEISTARSPALERAYQDRSAGLIYLHLDPGYKPLREDKRFADLVGRIGIH